jgi:hypothetical protein
MGVALARAGLDVLEDAGFRAEVRHEFETSRPDVPDDGAD